MKLDAGDLVLVPFPFTDLTATKTRPALVLSRASFNRQGSDAIVCAVTSNLTRAEHSVLLRDRDMERGSLKAASRIRVDKVATLSRPIIRKKLGTIRKPVLQRVMSEFILLFPLDS